MEANLENEVSEGGEVGAVPAVQMTLYLLDSDGILVLASHLVDAVCHADHALKRALDHLMIAVHRVVVVHYVLDRHSNTAAQSPSDTSYVVHQLKAFRTRVTAADTAKLQ